MLAAEAVGVCASFISTGIVTDVERMGRILKLLVAALEDFSSELGFTVLFVQITDVLQRIPSLLRLGNSGVLAPMLK